MLWFPVVCYGTCGKDNTAEAVWRSGSWFLEHFNCSHLSFRPVVLGKHCLSLFGRTVFSKTLVFLQSYPRERHSCYTSMSSDSRPGRTCFEGTGTYANPEPWGRLFFLVLVLIFNFLAYAHFHLNCNDLMIVCTLFPSWVILNINLCRQLQY